MVSERWRQIEQLYHLALDQEEGSRAAFVVRACGDDQALRQEVESLLAAGEGDDTYLETPAVVVAARARAQEEARGSMTGKTVSHYRVGEKLGGSAGVEVYRAEDTRLGRPVALKFLKSLAGDSPARQRFQREARGAYGLNHPNICTVYEIDELEGVPFLAMEFLEGKTLDHRLTGKALTIDQMLDLAVQIADGLDAAHTWGYPHRDLRPANLFITTRGEAKILGFGLALNRETPLERTESTAPGTAPYLSPEQVRGEIPDVRTDLFCLGALLYEMATGSRAFEGGTLAAILDAVLNRTPASVLQLNPSLPPKLDDVIGKALRKDRDLRYQNAADLRADLRRVKREVDAQRITRTIALPVGNAPAVQPDQPARLGRYQITGRLGEGGMGTVYQGIDPMIGRTVAIKTILQERLGSPKEADQLRKRLMREARAAGSLAHPNIVTVFDAGEEAGVTYIVMELIQGSTLAAMLPDTRTLLPTPLALGILAGAAAGLDFAHSRGVVHRDVKPSNIMIQADGTVKLADFGIARLVKATTIAMPGSVSGTLLFMSPEQLCGKEATARSDQYSLAVVAWILLTGSRPFDGGQLAALMQKILQEEPPHSSNLNPAADGVLRRALAKDPEARFPSCITFLAALRDACTPKPAARAETGRKQRRSLLVAGGVAACLLVGAGIAWRLRPPGLEPGRPEQKTNAISPAPMVSSPAVATQPQVTPPEQAPAASGKASTVKAQPAGNRPDTSPSRAAGTAPTGAGVRPQSSGANESKINPKDGLTYIWIPPGTFQMGCSPGDSECPENQKPVHQVTISRGFWMGQTEVTQEAWQRIMGTTPSSFKGAERPVESMSWDEAKNYCQIVGMRLPTEAEWEYAARAGSSQDPYGDLDQIAWYAGNSGKMAHPVGTKQANPWGLHDMLGNVWEWVADWFAAPYPDGSATDPKGPASGKVRTIRGGAWSMVRRNAHASFRGGPGPMIPANHIGFRCAGY